MTSDLTGAAGGHLCSVSDRRATIAVMAGSSGGAGWGRDGGRGGIVWGSGTNGSEGATGTSAPRGVHSTETTAESSNQLRDIDV